MADAAGLDVDNDIVRARGRDVDISKFYRCAFSACDNAANNACSLLGVFGSVGLFRHKPHRKNSVREVHDGKRFQYCWGLRWAV